MLDFNHRYWSFIIRVLQLGSQGRVLGCSPILKGTPKKVRTYAVKPPTPLIRGLYSSLCSRIYVGG
jgi:hypothetical protein